MSWSPVKDIITPRAIPANLTGYCLDAVRQADALTWAGGTGYKLVKTYQNSLVERDKPIYPAIAFSDDSDAQNFDNDIIQTAYSVTFRVSIQNAVADTAVTQARVYDKAFRSMMLNCPAATLVTNTGAVEALIHTIETGFLPIKAHSERKNDYLQEFDIRLTLTLIAASQ